MPLKSKAQARFLFAKKPKMAQEFADNTAGSIKDLPERIKPKGMRQPRSVTTVKKNMNSPLASYE
jgi:hypothetical protein